MRCVLPIEMTFTVDSASQLSSVTFQITVSFKGHNTDELLIKLTGAVVQTIEGTHVSLINLVVSDNIGV